MKPTKSIRCYYRFVISYANQIIRILNSETPCSKYTKKAFIKKLANIIIIINHDD